MRCGRQKLSKKLFGNHIPPACRTCAQGTLMPDGKKVLCERRGIVAPEGKCRHYFYDPLSRVPKRPLPLRPHKEEEFAL